MNIPEALIAKWLKTQQGTTAWVMFALEVYESLQARAAVPPMDKAVCKTCGGRGTVHGFDHDPPCPDCKPEPRDEREGKPCGWRELPGGCEIYPTRSEAYLLYGDDIEPLYLRPSPAALRVAEKMEEWASWADVDYAPRLRALAKQLRGGK